MRTWILIVVGWLVLSPVLQAQADWEVVIAHQREAVIRVEGTHNRRATGKILNVDDAVISIVNNFGDVARFQRADVRRVERLIGDPGAKTRGAQRGFLYGALISAATTYGIVMGSGGAKLPIVYGVLMGGGAALGALTTDSTADWVIIYTR